MVDTKLSALPGGKTPVFLYGEEGGNSRKYSGTQVVNVLDFMSTPGVIDADATAGCQAAIDFASQNFIGPVYFPPGGYVISAPGLQCNNPGKGSVALIGAGKEIGGTSLGGAFHGFIIDQNFHEGAGNNDLVPPPYTSQGKAFTEIAHMQVTNTMTSPGAACTSGTISGTTFTAAGTITGGLTNVFHAFQLGQTLYDPTTQNVYGNQIMASVPVALSSITRSAGGTTATATTSVAHGLTNGTTLVLDISGSVANVAVTNAVSGTGGVIRLTLATAQPFVNGDQVFVFGLTGSPGTTEANGFWTITVVDSTHIELNGSTFVHTYGSGGTVQYSPGATSYDGTYVCTVTGASTFTFAVPANVTNASTPGNYIGTQWTIDSAPYGNVTSIPISSNGFDQTVGGIRFNNSQSAILHDLSVTAFTGLVAIQTNFELTIMDCQFQSHGYRGCVGAHVGATVINCAAAGGFWIGFAVFEEAHLIGCRNETNHLGCMFGVDPWGRFGAANDSAIIGYTTERCDNGIFFSASNSIISCANTTGTSGPARGATACTGNGTTATLTNDGPSGGIWGHYLDDFQWYGSQTRQVLIEGGAFDSGGSPVTATRINSNQFTFPHSFNGSSTPSDWNFVPAAGVIIAGGGNIICSGVTASIGPIVGAGIDCNNSGFGNAQGVTFIGCSGGTAGWSMVTGAALSSHVFINCDQPTGSTLDKNGTAAGMTFSMLPGQGGVLQNPAREGMEFNIRDGDATLTFGHNETGGGTAHKKVRYNANTAQWTVMGV